MRFVFENSHDGKSLEVGLLGEGAQLADGETCVPAKDVQI